jgi:uncharacterized protein
MEIIFLNKCKLINMRKFLNISFIIVLCAFVACQQNDSQTQQNVPVATPSRNDRDVPSVSTDVAAQPNAAQTPEPIFVSEGELNFTDAQGKELSKLEIEIVDNAADRQKGLMFRKSMPEHQGMLFVFEEQEPQSFWMKNTLIPLDIIFVNDKNTVVSIQKNATPLSEKPLPSTGSALYVVETNGGYADKFGIKAGVKINFKKY